MAYSIKYSEVTQLECPKVVSMAYNGLGYDFVAEKSAGFFPP